MDEKWRAVTGAAKDALNQEVEMQEGDIWVAVGKPLKQFGGGRYRLNSEFLFFEKGVARTNAQQIRVAFITDIQLIQSISQKARKVGTLKLTATHPTGQVEYVEIEDIPDPKATRSIILETANHARNAERARNQTQFMQHSGTPASMAPPAQPQSQSAVNDDIMGKLKQLGELREAGILSDAEFEAKKQELLKRL